MQVWQQHRRAAAEQVPAVHLRVQVRVFGAAERAAAAGTPSSPRRGNACTAAAAPCLGPCVCGQRGGATPPRRRAAGFRRSDTEHACGLALRASPSCLPRRVPALCPAVRRCPVFLTLCHMLACSCMSYAVAASRMVQLQPVKSRQQFYKISLLALIFCLTVVLGNVSLKFIPVSFNQVCAGGLAAGGTAAAAPSASARPRTRPHTPPSPHLSPAPRPSAPPPPPSRRCWATPSGSSARRAPCTCRWCPWWWAW